MKKLFASLAVVLLFVGCSQGNTANYIQVKYRSDPVNVGLPAFVYLNTSRSSFIRGVWYDSSNEYMVINLSGTNYHYCGLPKSTWNLFKSADSFGKKYHSMIKGRYDCRINPIPKY